MPYPGDNMWDDAPEMLLRAGQNPTAAGFVHQNIRDHFLSLKADLAQSLPPPMFETALALVRKHFIGD